MSANAFAHFSRPTHPFAHFSISAHPIAHFSRSAHPFAQFSTRAQMHLRSLVAFATFALVVFVSWQRLLGGLV
jgi:hypothetical protein